MILILWGYQLLHLILHTYLCLRFEQKICIISRLSTFNPSRSEATYNGPSKRISFYWTFLSLNQLVPAVDRARKSNWSKINKLEENVSQFTAEWGMKQVHVDDGCADQTRQDGKFFTCIKFGLIEHSLQSAISLWSEHIRVDSFKHR